MECGGARPVRSGERGRSWMVRVVGQRRAASCCTVSGGADGRMWSGVRKDVQRVASCGTTNARCGAVVCTLCARRLARGRTARVHRSLQDAHPLRRQVEWECALDNVRLEAGVGVSMRQCAERCARGTECVRLGVARRCAQYGLRREMPVDLQTAQTTRDVVVCARRSERIARTHDMRMEARMQELESRV